MRPTARKASRERGSAKPGARGSGQRSSRGAPAPPAEPVAPRAAEDQEPPQERAPGFPIVAIGGSAGALSALQDFFMHLPADCGMGFVVITHADPSTPSMLPELLARCTRMSVREAATGQSVDPNHVYVVPPGRDVRIRTGALEVDPSPPRRLPGVRLPIDALFRSLGEDQHHRAVGIVLSGTGADGTVGLAAIRAGSGLAIAQDPASAEFAGMPSSAIAAGAVDLVLPTAEMPERLLAYTRMMATPGGGRAAAASGAGDELDRVLSIVHRTTGRDFSQYKRGTLQRRIERRMHLHQISESADYVAYLESHPSEVEALWKDWLIGVSHFFRDAEAFQALGASALPRLVAAKEEGSILRVWVPGCATGEEAYTIAILALEAVEELHKRIEIQIFATDLDARSIEVGRAGCYPEGIAADVGEERLRRYFLKEDRHYRVKKELRDLTVFAVQDMLRDPPFTRMDLISCRNVLIYLTAAAQKRIVPLFHYSLAPGGLLFLGTSETVTGFEDLFTAVDKRWKIYRRKDSALSARPAVAWAAQVVADVAAEREVGRPVGPKLDFTDLMRRQLVDEYAPPALLVDERGQIEQIHGRTGDFLEPAPGQARFNAIEMAREGLRAPLAALLRQVSSGGVEAADRVARVRTNGTVRRVRASVRRVQDAKLARPLYLVSFQAEAESGSDARARRAAPPPPAHGGKRVAVQLEEELRSARSDLQSTIEALQAANEELASANEEVQSVNEELQSTNEELQTSKEETQSLNEELQTVNAELTMKVHNLEEANDDLLNLINSTDIAMIFLDNRLRVKRFTPEAQRLFRLIPTDAGRPLADLTSSLEYPDLLADAENALETLAPVEREVRSGEGAWYTVRIRLYRTSRNAIDGLVLVFSNVSRLVQAERDAELARRLSEATVDAVREPLLVLDGGLHVLRANRAFYQTFGVAPEQTAGRLVYELGHRQWDIPALRDLLERVLPENRSFDGFEVRHDFPGLGLRAMRLNARSIASGKDGPPAMILLAFEDVTPGLGNHPAAGSEAP